MPYGPPKRRDPSELHGVISQKPCSCLFTLHAILAVKFIEGRKRMGSPSLLSIIPSGISRCRGYSDRGSGMGEAYRFRVSGKLQLVLASRVILGSGPPGPMTIFFFLPTLTKPWDSLCLCLLRVLWPEFEPHRKHRFVWLSIPIGQHALGNGNITVTACLCVKQQKNLLTP
jgi:hypothetical protein